MAPISTHSGKIRYGLVHVVYVVTVLGCWLAVLGARGVVPGIIVCIFWGWVFISRSRPKTLLIASVAMLLVYTPFMLPALGVPYEVANHWECTNNLKQISLALLEYHDVYGEFPPAFLTDEKGQPKHSWRVLILPFLQEKPLYDQYNFDEPWNGPHNRKLLHLTPQVYSCPSAGRENNGSGYTSYVAVVGPTTAWPGRTGRKLADFKDGSSNTVLVVECNHPSIAWLEPKDLKINEAIERLSSTDSAAWNDHQMEDVFYTYYLGQSVAFADGSVRVLRNPISYSNSKALFGADDEIALDNEVINPSEAVKRLRLDNCVRLALAIMVTLFPLPWVWLNSNGASINSAQKDRVEGNRS